MQIAARVARRSRVYFARHVAGDILSTDYLRGMCRVARANPHTHFSHFTKAFDIVNRYEDREVLPDNLVIIFSAWPGMTFDNPHRHRVAWMQDGTESRVPEDAIRCSGNCETCGLRYELPRLDRDVSVPTNTSLDNSALHLLRCTISSEPRHPCRSAVTPVG